MKISAKIELFKDSRLDSIAVNAAQLDKVGISKARFLKNCLFEKSINQSSPIISKKPDTFVGAYSYMNDGGYVKAWVFIGRFCSIGRRVSIGAGAHPMSGLSTHPLLVHGRGKPYSDSEAAALRFRIPANSPTVIGNDVWIGDGVVVVPGVRIGTGAVIGANSVVTKDVPPYAIAAGVPAAVIRYRFPEETASRLLASEWWEYPLDFIRSLPRKNAFGLLESLEGAGAAGGLEPAVYETYRLGCETGIISRWFSGLFQAASKGSVPNPSGISHPASRAPQVSTDQKRDSRHCGETYEPRFPRFSWGGGLNSPHFPS